MSFVTRLLNTVAALCATALALLIIWFLVSFYFGGFDAAATIADMRATLLSWWGAVAR